MWHESGAVRGYWTLPGALFTRAALWDGQSCLKMSRESATHSRLAQPVTLDPHGKTPVDGAVAQDDAVPDG